MDMQSRSPAPCATADLIARLVAHEGTAAHGYCQASLANGAQGFVRDPVDFADAVHHLSMLHGHLPGVIDHAATRIADNEARAWLLRTVEGFAQERAYLNMVVVAAGPLPSTSGQHEVTTIVAQQRRALDMLAQSDRRGCALGAAMALVIDWYAVRRLIDAGAARMHMEARPYKLPPIAETLNVLTAVEGQASAGRAVQFGASQLLSQHRGVWDLLQARAEVRSHV